MKLDDVQVLVAYDVCANISLPGTSDSNLRLIVFRFNIAVSS